MINPDGYYNMEDEYMMQEDEWEGLMDPAWERQQTKVNIIMRCVAHRLWR